MIRLRHACTGSEAAFVVAAADWAAFAVVMRYLGEQIDVRTQPESSLDPDPELGSAP